ncbi:unnamed protein product [Prunus brigantina]
MAILIMTRSMSPFVRDLKYDGEGCVRVHIAKMLDIGNRLRSLDANVDEAIIVYFAINSLSSSFKLLSSTYTLLKRRCGL